MKENSARKDNINAGLKILDDFANLYGNTVGMTENNYKKIRFAIDNILLDYKRVLKENEELKIKTERKKIKDLECHCGECDDEIYRICEKYCNYQDDEVALCERERFANMNVEDYEKIEETLRIEKNAEDIIEKLQKENEELKSSNEKLERANKCYINSIHSIVPVLNQDYIEKQKIKDKIEELKQERILKYDNYMGYKIESREQQDIDKKINALQNLLEEKGG